MKTTRTPVLVALFFLSGVSGLVYQVVWLRMLFRAFGVTVYAVSTVVAVFMGGLALGSLVAARVARRWSERHSPLRLYALLELAIGVLAAGATAAMLALPGAFETAVTAVGADSGAVPLLRLILAAVVLLPPTTCMGATLPLVSGYLTSRLGSAGKQAGWLYGMNTLGAVVGVMGSGFVLLATLGEIRTVAVAVACNLAVAAGGAWLDDGERVAPSDDAPTSGDGSSLTRRLLVVAFVSGACALAFEVIWARVLTVLLGNSVYGFSAMLAAYLVGIGVGSAVMARRVDRIASPLRLFGYLEIANAMLGLVSLLVFVQLALQGDQARYRYSVLWSLGDFGRLALHSVLIVLPVTLIYGAIFPLASRLVARGAPNTASAIGRLYGYNTIGGILGSIVAGFVLIPAIGTLPSFLVASSISLGIGLYLLWLAHRRESPFGARTTGLLATLGFLLLVWFSTVDPFLTVLKARVGASSRLIAHREDRGATLSVFESERTGSHTLFINGLYVSNTYPGVGEQMVNLPLAFHPEPGPKKILVIGLGVGESLRYAIDVGHDITIVELHEGVVELFEELNEDARHYLDHPNSTIVINDGRNHLLYDDTLYDLILVDGSPPVYAAGMVNLYAAENMRMARRRLTDDGVFVVWFPVVCFEADFWMVLHNFADTFEGVQVFSPPDSANAMLLGTNGSERVFPLDPTTFSRRVARWSRYETLQGPAYLRGLTFDVDKLVERARTFPEVTDDRPYTEFPLQRFWRGEPYYRTNAFLYEAGPDAPR